MKNLTLTSKALTLATLLALTQNPALGGEDLLALAPDAAYHTAEAPRSALHKNTIKLKLPSREFDELNNKQFVEINPAASNGVINFNIPDHTSSFMPPPPGGSGSTPVRVPRLVDNPVPVKQLTDTSSQPDAPQYRALTSATIFIPAAQAPASDHIETLTILPEVSPLTRHALRPSPVQDPSFDATASSAIMPGLITPEQLATGLNYSSAPFAPARAELSDLVSFTAEDVFTPGVPDFAVHGTPSVYSSDPVYVADSGITASAEYGDIMTMAASPVQDVLIPGDVSFSSPQAVVSNSGVGLGYRDPFASSDPFEGGSSSFHSFGPVLAQPEALSVSALPPASRSTSVLPPPPSPRSNDSDTGGGSSGPLRLSIAPLVNMTTSLDSPPAGTIAAGQPSTRPPLADSSVGGGVSSSRVDVEGPTALSAGEFSSFDVRDRRDSREVSSGVSRREGGGARASSGGGKVQRQSRKRERDEPRRVTGRRRDMEREGFTNMRDVRNVIGPPDPGMFR